MNTEQAAENKKIFINNAVEAVIRIGLLLLMAAWCFDITKPFLIMIVWGVIIAVASYPLYIKLCNYLHNRNVLASVIITSALLAIIFVPTIILSTTAIQSATDIAQQLKSGEVVIPEPPGNVQNWPLVGPQISDTWTLASDNLSEALAKIKPQLKSTGLWLLKMIKSAGASILIFLAAVVIAGFILVNANSGQRLAHQFAIRIMGEKGHQYAVLAGKIIRSVTQGILGIDILQSSLAGLGFWIMDVPAAGLWAFLCLLLGVIQIGPMPVILAVAIYVMSTVNTLPGIVFLVWSIGIGLIDNILKPLLLGRGVDIPMPVIFVGAIGGFLNMGIIGLFLGSIVLALSYSLFLMWLGDEPEKN